MKHSYPNSQALLAQPQAWILIVTSFVLGIWVAPKTTQTELFKSIYGQNFSYQMKAGNPPKSAAHHLIPLKSRAHNTLQTATQLKSKNKKSAAKLNAKNATSDKKKSQAAKAAPTQGKNKNLNAKQNQKANGSNQSLHDTNNLNENNNASNENNLKSSYSAQAYVQDQKATENNWRAILLSQPTSENLDKFLFAFKQGQISAEDFFSITEELLLSNHDTYSSAAIYLLSKTIQPQSFELIAAHYDHSSELQTKFDFILTSYQTEPGLTITKNYLHNYLSYSSNTLSLALKQVVSSAQLSKSVNYSNGRKDRSTWAAHARQNSSYAIDSKTYQSILKMKNNSQDPEIKQMAANAYEQLSVLMASSSESGYIPLAQQADLTE